MGYLYSSGRYLGNTDDYYDPRNSLLHEVLDRRVGIPITLAVLGMEVGRRIGVPLSGVGMPGHFLVRDKVDPSVFIDPFHAGRELDAAGCQALHRAMAGPDAPWDPGYLDPIDRPAIVDPHAGQPAGDLPAQQRDRLAALGGQAALRHARRPDRGPPRSSSASWRLSTSGATFATDAISRPLRRGSRMSWARDMISGGRAGAGTLGP